MIIIPDCFVGVVVDHCKLPPSKRRQKDNDRGKTREFKDPALPIEQCTLRFLGGHFCDVENSEAFVCGQNRTLL